MWARVLKKTHQTRLLLSLVEVFIYKAYLAQCATVLRVKTFVLSPQWL